MVAEPDEDIFKFSKNLKMVRTAYNVVIEPIDRRLDGTQSMNIAGDRLRVRTARPTSFIKNKRFSM